MKNMAYPRGLRVVCAGNDKNSLYKGKTFMYVVLALLSTQHEQAKNKPMATKEKRRANPCRKQRRLRPCS